MLSLLVGTNLKKRHMQKKAVCLRVLIGKCKCKWSVIRTDPSSHSSHVSLGLTTQFPVSYHSGNEVLLSSNIQLKYEIGDIH